MTDAMMRYRELFVELLTAREARGPLVEQEEAQFVKRLSEAWEQMTPEEQAEVSEEQLTAMSEQRGHGQHMIAGEAGEVTVDLAQGWNNLVSDGSEEFWCVKELAVDDLDSVQMHSEDFLEIVSGLSVAFRIDLLQLRAGPWPMRFIQPPRQNFTVRRLRRGEPVNEGIVRVRWSMISSHVGSVVWR